MKYLLLPSSAFRRAAKRHLKKNPSAVHDFEATLEQLAQDPYHPVAEIPSPQRVFGRFVGMQRGV